MAKVVGVGTCAGLLGSLVGLGGGFVAIPMLTGALKLSQHQAHGTSLAAVVGTGTAGALSYGSLGSVDWTSAAAITAGGVFTAPLGARFASRLSQRHLKMAMGCFQLAVAPLIPLKPYLISKAEDSTSPLSEHRQIAMAAIGGMSGFLAGLFGVGGGAVVVPAVCFMTDHTHHCALGTSLAAMVIPSAMGTATHYALGNVVPKIAAPLALGTVVGSAIGAQIVSSIPEEPLRYIFSAFMLFLGTKALRGL